MKWSGVERSTLLPFYIIPLPIQLILLPFYFILLHSTLILLPIPLIPLQFYFILRSFCCLFRSLEWSGVEWGGVG